MTVILRSFLKIGSERWLLQIFGEVSLNSLRNLILLQAGMLRNFDERLIVHVHEANPFGQDLGKVFD